MFYKILIGLGIFFVLFLAFILLDYLAHKNRNDE